MRSKKKKKERYVTSSELQLLRRIKSRRLILSKEDTKIRLNQNSLWWWWPLGSKPKPHHLLNSQRVYCQGGVTNSGPRVSLTNTDGGSAGDLTEERSSLASLPGVPNIADVLLSCVALGTICGCPWLLCNTESDGGQKGESVGGFFALWRREKNEVWKEPLSRWQRPKMVSFTWQRDEIV